MTNRRARSRGEVLRAIAILVAVLAMATVLIVDIATGLWQDVVILSGVVAGLLTFILTALFLDRLLARSEHVRWLPVTRLALTDIAHALADDDESEVARGRIVPRSLPDPTAGGGAGPTRDDIDGLLQLVVLERQRVTESLGRWSAFLAASGDVQEFMIHIASLAEQLDAIRDAAMAAERTDDSGDIARLGALTQTYNASIAAATEEITSLLET